MSSTLKYDSLKNCWDSDPREALSLVWPDNVPDEETALWLQLDDEMRATAARRIRALSDYEAQGGKKAPLFAKAAGVSVARFYVMLREWRAEKSLAVVVPHSRPRAKAQPADEKLIAAVREILAADLSASDDRVLKIVSHRPEHEGMQERELALHIKKQRSALVREAAAAHATEVLKTAPNAKKEFVAQAVRAQMGDLAPSLSLLRRIVDEAKTEIERAGIGGDEGFGRHVLLDSTAVEIPVQRGDELEWAVVFMIVDQATGFIIGWALGQHRHDNDTWLASVAAQSAIQRLSTVDIPLADPSNGDEPEFSIVIEFADAMAILREIRRLSSLSVRAAVISEGSRRHGSLLLPVLGSRLGDVDLLPRYATSNFRGRRPPKLGDAGVVPRTDDEVTSILEVKVRQHNDAVLRRGIRAAVPVPKLAAALQELYPSS